MLGDAGRSVKPSPHHRWLVIYISTYLLIGNYLRSSRHWYSPSMCDILPAHGIYCTIEFPSETLYWNGVDRRLTFGSCTKPDLAALCSSVILLDQFFTGLYAVTLGRN